MMERRRNATTQFLKASVLVTLCLITNCITSYAQVKVTSGFIPDSVVVGDHAAYYLTATYPKKLQVLFPDSTFSFQPFEFEKKKYFTTQTSDSLSYDSAVYTLSTFEVDLVQHLQLPVFILHQQDCTTLLSLRDSVILKQLVTIPLPDTLKAENLPLISNTAYEPVAWLLNYPLLLIITGVLLIVIVVGWIIFGKRIRKHFTVKRLQKEHATFMQTFNEQFDLLKQQFSPHNTERILLLWKRYMETLDARPYTKLTTKETALLLEDQALGMQLRRVDAAVYGNNRNIEEPLFELRNVAVNTFQQKLDRVTHG